MQLLWFFLSEPHTDGCAVSAQCSTEELCRGAARKLSTYQLTAQQQGLGETIELGSRGENKAAVNANSSSGSPTSVSTHDPPPSVPLAEAGLQIPLERGDTAVSFIIPPPPPSSPGDALRLANQSGQELTQVYDAHAPHPHELPLPHPPYSPYVALNPLLYQNLAVPQFAVVAAAPPPAASVQTTQPPPTQFTNINKTDVHQNTVSYHVERQACMYE